VKVSGLFETMRYSTGPIPDQLESHLDRIQASASHFGVSFDRDQANRLIASACSGLYGRRRVRLSLSGSGELSVGVVEFPVLTPAVSLVLAASAVESTDARLRYKIADRSLYAEMRRGSDGADDVIMHNERGEVTETTIANLAFGRDGRWWTPPLECGLLPGIERERLISTGLLAERVLMVGDLAQLDGIATVNALRGWQDAVFAGPSQRVSGSS